MKLSDLVKDPTKLETHGKFASPEERMERIRDGDTDPRLVKAVATDPEQAYDYAAYTNSRFPEGERAIAKKSFLAYKYAKDIIKDRWPKREQTLLQQGPPYRLYWYAMDVIKDRWPEREPLIAQNASASYSYAKDVIKDRFPEGERAIAKDPIVADHYKHFLKRLQMRDKRHLPHKWLKEWDMRVGSTVSKKRGQSLIKPSEFDKGNPEMKYHNTMDPRYRDIGSKKNIRPETVVIRSSGTGKVYGRRTVVQKGT